MIIQVQNKDGKDQDHRYHNTFFENFKEHRTIATYHFVYIFDERLL